MSTDASDAGPTEQRATDDRYAALRVADAATVIYDVSNHRAWIQSDRATSLEGME